MTPRDKIYAYKYFKRPTVDGR